TNEHRKLADVYAIDARGRQDAKERSARLREAARIYSDALAEPAQAAVVLREARTADPTDALLLIELVDTLAAAGELPAAVEELTQAIEPLPEDDSLR